MFGLKRINDGWFNKRANLGVIDHSRDYAFDREKLDNAHHDLQSIARETSDLAKTVGESIEERLNDSEIRLGKILNAISDFILVKDGEGRWKLLNSYGCELFGLSKKDYLDKKDEDILETFPHLKFIFKNCTRSDELTWKKKAPRREEEAFDIGKGKMYFDVIKTPIYDEFDDRKELIIIGRDITSVKERQKRMKAAYTALNVSSDLISIADKEGSIIFANDKFIEAYGYNSHLDVIGKHMSVIKNGVPKEEYDKLWKHISSNKMWHGVLNNFTQSGQPIKVDTTILPIKNGIPQPIYYVCRQSIV